MQQALPTIDAFRAYGSVLRSSDFMFQPKLADKEAAAAARLMICSVELPPDELAHDCEFKIYENDRGWGRQVLDALRKQGTFIGELLEPVNRAEEQEWVVTRTYECQFVSAAPVRREWAEKAETVQMTFRLLLKEQSPA